MPSLVIRILTQPLWVFLLFTSFTQQPVVSLIVVLFHSCCSTVLQFPRGFAIVFSHFYGVFCPWTHNITLLVSKVEPLIIFFGQIYLTFFGSLVGAMAPPNPAQCFCFAALAQHVYLIFSPHFYLASERTKNGKKEERCPPQSYSPPPSINLNKLGEVVG